MYPCPQVCPKHRAGAGAAGSVCHRPAGRHRWLRGAWSMRPKVLLLGGVTEALALARQMQLGDIYSLAGLGRVPEDLPCQVRVGGFGGAEGMARFIAEHKVQLVIDATHPYAAQISANAARAAQLAGVPCWALRRPGW